MVLGYLFAFRLPFEYRMESVIFYTEILKTCRLPLGISFILSCLKLKQLKKKLKNSFFVTTHQVKRNYGVAKMSSKNECSVISITIFNSNRFLIRGYIDDKFVVNLGRSVLLSSRRAG